MKILQPKDIKDDLIRLWETGGQKCYPVGYKCMHGHYGMVEASCTDWTGFPVSGKTEVMFDFLMNMSQLHNWRHLMFVPDAGTKEKVIAMLIHKYCGKTFKKTWIDGSGNEHENQNFISKDEMMRYQLPVMDAFKFLVPEVKNGRTEKITPYKFWDFAAENRMELKLNTAVIDSWKDLKHDYSGGGYATYLEEVLPYRNSLAEESGLHFHTVIHPKSPQRLKDGKYPVPTEHDLKGGSEWFNSGKSMIVIHRETKTTPTTDIYVKKAKPEEVGRAGDVVSLNYDVATRRFYEYSADGREKLFARDYTSEPAQEKILKPLQPNVDFTTSNREEEEDTMPF